MRIPAWVTHQGTFKNDIDDTVTIWFNDSNYTFPDFSNGRIFKLNEPGHVFDFEIKNKKPVEIS